MTTRNVKRVIAHSAERRPSGQAFPFTQNMIPSQNGGGAAVVGQHRAQAWEVFQELPIPHTGMEAWRRTDLKRLDAGGLRLPGDGAYLDMPEVPAHLLLPLAGEEHGGQIVLKPGGVEVELSPVLAAKGIIFTDYATAERSYPEILQKILGKIVRSDEGKFAAMISALASNGLLLYVPPNVIVDQPLHSVIWAPGKNLAHFSQVMVYLEDGASATYVQETASPADDSHNLNGLVVEIFVGENANLRYVELQSLGANAWNFTHERVRVHRHGQVDWIFGAIGSHLTKNFSDLDLVGEGSTGRMSGFYFTDGIQHLDHDTQQNHMAPHTTSDLLFKGALKDESHSVWQGMIYVAPGAQKTDGYQANRNLVLNPNAKADSIPGLEILADDVRCTHGATVGKIDPELVFYLQSRGVPLKEAERLVVEGFFDPIMQRIPYERVRERFQQAITHKMD